MLKEEDVEEFIKSNAPEFDFNAVRIVLDSKGISRKICFVDFNSPEDAKKCSKILNNKILDDNVITCAVSKPPKLGENDKRTIYINNISYGSTEESIKSAFEPFGTILGVRIIDDKHTDKPRGYGYVEFAEEESVENILKSKSKFVVDGRNLMVKASQSVAKIRENVKHVAHVTNLPFSLSEEKLKQFFIKYKIEKIKDCLINKKEDGITSKGFGFVEFEDEVK